MCGGRFFVLMHFYLSRKDGVMADNPMQTKTEVQQNARSMSIYYYPESLRALLLLLSVLSECESKTKIAMMTIKRRSEHHYSVPPAG